MKNKIFYLMAVLFFLFFLILSFYSDWNINYKELDYECKDCNLIIISITNLRYDHLGVYGYNRDTSPNIDKFAKESIVFNNFFTPATWTLPAGISLFTSLYPFQHGVMARYDGSSLRKIKTLVEYLKEEGYETSAFTGGFDYVPFFGLTSRFDTNEFNDVFDPQQKGGFRVEVYGLFDSSIPLALDWLNKNKNKKFFLFIQGFDIHCPFTPKEPYDKLYDTDYNGSINYSSCLWTFDKTDPIFINNISYYVVSDSSPEPPNQFFLNQNDINHLIALYDGEVAYTDSLIGEFLEQIKEMDLFSNTIIIILSEHGDIFGKYGRFMRGGPLRGTFYDDVIHVPLIIRHPKLKPTRIDGLSQIVDIMPTILDFLRIKSKNKLEGVSLIPLILENKSVNEYIFGGSIFTEKSSSKVNYTSEVEYIRNKDWKLIKETLFIGQNETKINYELFNLKEDPEELNNIYHDKNVEKIREDLRERLFNWQNKFNESLFKS